MLHLKENRPCSMVNVKRLDQGEKDAFDGYTVYGMGILLYETACHGYFWNLMVSFYDLFFLLVWRNYPTEWGKQLYIRSLASQS